jgi:hypothetical protein
MVCRILFSRDIRPETLRSVLLVERGRSPMQPSGNGLRGHGGPGTGKTTTIRCFPKPWTSLAQMLYCDSKLAPPFLQSCAAVRLRGKFYRGEPNVSYTER